MFCHSQAVMFKTLGNGDFRFIDILKISAYKMLPVAQKTFSLIFVSKKPKLKISQGGEAPAQATSAFEMVPSSEFVYTIRLQAHVPSGVLGCTPWLRALGKLDKIRFSLDFRRNHLKRRSFLGLNSPHILG